MEEAWFSLRPLLCSWLSRSIDVKGLTKPRCFPSASTPSQHLPGLLSSPSKGPPMCSGSGAICHQMSHCQSKALPPQTGLGPHEGMENNAALGRASLAHHAEQAVPAPGRECGPELTSTCQTGSACWCAATGTDRSQKGQKRERETSFCLLLYLLIHSGAYSFPYSSV